MEQYSTFNDWRDHLADVSECIDIESLPLKRRNAYGYWEETPDDVMTVLMAHHDDAGFIFPKEARGLKDRIEGIKPGVSPEWRTHTKRFLKALSLCIKTGQRIEFT